MLSIKKWKSLVGFTTCLLGLMAEGKTDLRNFMEEPSPYTKQQIELSTLHHFVRLEGEKGTFYKILSIDTYEVKSPVYNRPGIRTVIGYSTPECKANYYEGTAYEYYCSKEECPVAIVYQKCI